MTLCTQPRFDSRTKSYKPHNSVSFWARDLKPPPKCSWGRCPSPRHLENWMRSSWNFDGLVNGLVQDCSIPVWTCTERILWIPEARAACQKAKFRSNSTILPRNCRTVYGVLLLGKIYDFSKYGDCFVTCQNLRFWQVWRLLCGCVCLCVCHTIAVERLHGSSSNLSTR